MTKNILLACITCFVLTLAASAQSSPCDSVQMPEGTACVTRQTAIDALTNRDKVAALEVESKAKDQAIADLKAADVKMQINFAGASGELTQCKQNAVSDRAIIDILVKQVRPKKIGLINF